MKALVPLALLAILVSGASCVTTDSGSDFEKQYERPYQGATFQLRQPALVTAVLKQGEGRAVHYFRLEQSGSTMGIYEGIEPPRLFSPKEKGLVVTRRGNTSREEIEQGDDVWGEDAEGNLWRESVWHCRRTVRDDRGKTFHLPTILHIWYFGVPQEHQGIFDAMIDTIEMKR